MEDDIDFNQVEPVGPINLVPCPSCGRTFNEKSLGKHQPICEKTRANAAKRGIFDATKQRIVAVEEAGGKKPSKSSSARSSSKRAKPAAAAATPKDKGDGKKGSDWRAKREAFVQQMRQARKVTQVMKAGGDISALPPPPPTINDDYVQCPHCDRRFEQNAAERHIPFCEEQARRNAMKKSKEDQKSEALKRRTNYRPPRPKTRSASTSSSSASSPRRLVRSGSFSSSKTSQSLAAPAETGTRPRTRSDSGFRNSGGDTSRRPPRPPEGFSATLPVSRRHGSGGAVRSSRARQQQQQHLHQDLQRMSLSDDESTLSRVQSGYGTSPSPDLPASGYPFHRARIDVDDVDISATVRSTRSLGSASSTNSRGPVRLGSGTSKPKFCGQCGCDLSKPAKNYCYECGHPFADRDKFCAQCGARR